MRALVTGITGFVGSHLADAIADAGGAVWGLTRSSRAGSSVHRTVVCSFADRDRLSTLIGDVRPTHVFHFAGVLKDDQHEIAATYDANVTATVRLLQAIRDAGLDARVVVASSSAVYGRPRILPITEDAPLQPVNDYGASKVGQEMAAVAAHASHGMRVMRTRMFNLVGPRQSDRFVTATIASQIAAAERSGGGTLRLGNVSARRDYTDVRDAVAAHLLIARHGVPGDVYNVCSGRSYAVAEALELMVRDSGCRIDVITDPARGSIVDIDEQVGSFDRLARLTHWSPRITFEQSLRDLLAYWRSRTRDGAITK